MGAAEQGRAIRTVDEALLWGDEWAQAYREHLAELYAQIERLNDAAFLLQTRAVIAEAECLLLRHDIAKALSQVYQSEAA